MNQHRALLRTLVASTATAIGELAVRRDEPAVVGRAAPTRLASSSHRQPPRLSFDPMAASAPTRLALRPLLPLSVCIIALLLLASAAAPFAAASSSSLFRRLLDAAATGAGDSESVKAAPTLAESTIDADPSAWNRPPSSAARPQACPSDADQATSIEAGATASTTVDTDLVRSSLVVEVTRFARGFDPREMYRPNAEPTEGVGAEVKSETGRTETTEPSVAQETPAAAPTPALPAQPATADAAPAPVAISAPASQPITSAIDTRFKSGPSPPSDSELRALLLSVQTEQLSALSRLNEYLSALNRVAKPPVVQRLHSDAIYTEPQYDYGCRSSNGTYNTQFCDYSRPIVVGYRSSTRLSFESPIGSALRVLAGAIDKSNGGARVESISNVASERLIVEAERSSAAEATRESLAKAAAVAGAIKQGEAHSADLRVQQVICSSYPYYSSPMYIPMAAPIAAFADGAQSPSSSGAAILPPQLSSSTVAVSATCTIKVKLL